MDERQATRRSDEPRRHWLRRLEIWASVVVLAGAGILGGFYLRRRPKERAQALSAMFRVLESRGFRANPGLAGSFEPGTLVQVRERDGAGAERDLPEPVVFKWGRECFPALEPQDLQYALPESSGKLSDQLDFDGTVVDKEAPALSLKDQSVASYRLRFGRARLRAFAKGDLSGGFAPACVDALDRATASGEPASWYRLVLETVTVDSLDYEIEWRQATDSSSRAALADLLRRQLAGSLGRASGPSVAIEAKATAEDRTVLSVSAQAILAYRLRPVELAEVQTAAAEKKSAGKKP